MAGKSIEELECELNRLKDFYELCGLDLSQMKRSYHSHAHAKRILHCNKNKDHSSLINQQNRIIKTTKDVYKKYNRIRNIEISIRKKRKQISNKNESTTCFLSTIHNNVSIEQDSQPNTNIIVAPVENLDTFSSNNPIENQPLPNINPTTNIHTNDNLLSQTSHTNNNQIEHLSHQNSDNEIVNNEVLPHQNNDNQIAYNENSFYEQCDCRRARISRTIVS